MPKPDSYNQQKQRQRALLWGSLEMIPTAYEEASMAHAKTTARVEASKISLEHMLKRGPKESGS